MTLARVDVCFRKKGWVGWYNGKITSDARLSKGQKSIYLETKLEEYSPHKYLVLSSDDATLEVLKNTPVPPVEFKVNFDRGKYAFTGVAQVDYNKLAKLQNGLGFIENWKKWESVRLLKKIAEEIAGNALYLGVLILASLL